MSGVVREPICRPRVDQLNQVLEREEGPFKTDGDRRRATTKETVPADEVAVVGTRTHPYRHASRFLGEAVRLPHVWRTPIRMVKFLRSMWDVLALLRTWLSIGVKRSYSDAQA